ncbi:MAG TPA: S1/P1 nuclease [Steroidobacteraceae bacterium]|nr:S1/P1 nuclease [Steroidobacteraceae bacterium]
MLLPKSCLLAAAIAALGPAPAAAWGDLGHQVTALLAYRHLTPQAKLRLDALLAADTDSLTPPDFASRATWADKYRTTHRETAAWHFVDIEIDAPDLQSACFGFPTLGASQLASQGPAQDCIVNKIEEFAGELQGAATPPAERLLALKFVIHLVGDLHQPLHAADHDDRGGNCIGLSASADRNTARAPNLHAYWDLAVVDAQGASAEQIADKLDAGISAALLNEWASGTARSWAMETFEIARHDAYALPSRPTCGTQGSVALPQEYEAEARKVAAAQLQKAAIRMASILNRALGN